MKNKCPRKIRDKEQSDVNEFLECPIEKVSSDGSKARGGNCGTGLECVFLSAAAVAALSVIFLITSAAAFAVNVPQKIQPNRIQTRKVNSAPRLNSNSMNVPNGPNVPEKIREAPAQTAEDIQKYEDEQERLRILREYWQIMYPSNSTVQPNKEINKNKE